MTTILLFSLVGVWVGSWLIFCKQKGYLNRGPDDRIFGKIGGWVQSLFSWPFSWLTAEYPLHLGPYGSKHGLFIGLFPLFFSLFIYKGDGRWASFRAGWRYDKYMNGTGGYIADVIIKLRINNLTHY